jgi:Ni/Fe-hydrogenase subunit HybB-like protein
MVESTIGATQAVVSMDVAHNTIIWGSIITVNMWAKSIGTGVIFLAAYLFYRHKKEEIPNVRWIAPLISFLALNLFLFFTLIDLHQPYRMIHIFLHPHWTSSITVGAWLASLFTLLITILMVIGAADAFPEFFKKSCKLPPVKFLAKKASENSGVYEKIFPFVVFLAIPVTTYTAIIMAQSAARELWVAPTEVMQMIWAALMAGASVFLLVSGGWSKEARKEIALILAFSVLASFLMYMGEYFFSYKSAEAEATLAFIHAGGPYSIQFWFAMVLGYIAPFFLVVTSIKDDNKTLYRVAALLALIGLFLAKDVWLKIPQILPLS